MCGIIGRISLNTNPIKSLLGLKELEYRGYDSYGILFYNLENKNNILQKDIGEIDLSSINKFKNIKSNIEIGHTRWATHGKVSKENAHPHFDKNKKFFIVMNGIIENYSKIKKELINKKIKFISQTDTEIISHLYNLYYKDLNDLESSIIETTKIVLSKLKGEFSFILKFENLILGYKNINPLIVGISKDELFFSSDLNLIEQETEKYFILEDKEFFVSLLKKNKLELNIFNEKFKKIKKNIKNSNKNKNEISKNTKYYMQKEILEQKELKNFLTNENINNLKYIISKFKDKEIYITSAGSSYHAGMFMHYQLLKKKIYSNIILASELKNYIALIKNSIIIIFSQSGETADLIFPLKILKKNNEIFTITNSKNSTLDRFAKKSIYLNCGREISVASTKAFVFQIFSIFIIKNLLDNVKFNIKNYESNFEEVITNSDGVINNIIERFNNVNDFFFLGRNQFYPLALEGALKLKEISYLHAEGFAGGELKHGSLALIKPEIPIFILGGDKEIISNAIEIKSRGGIIIGIDSENKEIYDYFLEVPKNFIEIYSVIIMQILALKIALFLGLNPDKPRNLAKSVTVK